MNLRVEVASMQDIAIGWKGKQSHMSVGDVLPQLEVSARGMSLCSYMASFCDWHLEHQTAAVVRDASHHIQTTWCPGNPQVCLQPNLSPLILIHLQSADQLVFA